MFYYFVEKKPLIATPSMSWLWYTIGSTFLVIGLIAVSLAIIIFKRRNSANGSWSRESEREEEYYKKNLKKFCCTSQLTFEDNIENIKSVHKPELELKQCIKNESFRKMNTTPDEFTESLFGTFDRLICTDQSQLTISSANEFSSSVVLPCTSASLYKEVEINRVNDETITTTISTSSKTTFPPLPLSIIKSDFDYKIAQPEF
jgi:hypothetical protein